MQIESSRSNKNYSISLSPMFWQMLRGELFLDARSYFSKTKPFWRKITLKSQWTYRPPDLSQLCFNKKPILNQIGTDFK